MSQAIDAWFPPSVILGSDILRSNFTVKEDVLNLNDLRLATFADQSVPYWVLDFKHQLNAPEPFAVALPALIISDRVPELYRVPVLLHKLFEMLWRTESDGIYLLEERAARSMATEDEFLRDYFKDVTRNRYLAWLDQVRLEQIRFMESVYMTPNADAYPTVDPLLLADIDPTGEVLAADYQWSVAIRHEIMVATGSVD